MSLTCVLYEGGEQCLDNISGLNDKGLIKKFIQIGDKVTHSELKQAIEASLDLRDGVRVAKIVGRMLICRVPKPRFGGIELNTDIEVQMLLTNFHNCPETQCIELYVDVTREDEDEDEDIDEDYDEDYDEGECKDDSEDDCKDDSEDEYEEEYDDDEEDEVVKELVVQDQQELTHDFIVKAVKELLVLKPDISVKKTIAFFGYKYNRTISYKKAWLGRCAALESTYDNWVESYADLPRYILAIKNYIPGSVIDLSFVEVYGHARSTNRCFQRCFWAFGPCIAAFEYLKPILQIDGTQLHGKFKGKLLIATAQDGNQNIIPIAFSIVEGESYEAWKYFLGHVHRSIVRNKNNVVVISNCSPAIKSIMREDPAWKPPTVHHYLCVSDIALDFQKMFNNKKMKNYFIDTSYFFKKDIVEQRLAHLRSLGPDIGHFFDELPLQMWSRAHDEGRRWGQTQMTTSHTKCMNDVLNNIHMLPITSIVEGTLYKLVEHFVQNLSSYTAQKTGGAKFSEYLLKMVAENSMLANCHIVIQSDETIQEFEIRDDGSEGHNRPKGLFKLNMNTMICECGEWQAFKYPCSHALKVCQAFRLNWGNYVHAIYTLDCLIKAYGEQQFTPLPSDSTWPIYEARVIPDPLSCRFMNPK